MKVKKIYLTGQLYYQAKTEKWLVSLSYYVYLSYLFPQKKFSVKQYMEKNKKHHDKTLYKHLNILTLKGLCVKNNETYTLVSNDTLKSMYRNNAEIKKGIKAKFKLFISNENVLRDINRIKYFLKTIPLISNLYAQQKKELIKDKFRKTEHKLQNNYFISIKEYKAYQKFIKKHNTCEKSKIQISIKGTKKVIKAGSEHTAVKYRKIIQKNKVTKNKRNIEIIEKNSSFEMFLCLYVLDSKLRFKKGTIYKDKCTSFKILV
jgi:hypothetical protein